MNQSHLFKLLVLTLGITTSIFANAHGVEGGGFINGIKHPVFGIDHLLAMVAVGVLSVQLGGRAIWAVPLAFVSVMVVGGLMGVAGTPFFALETGIALSVLALGLAIALDKQMPVILSILFVGFFALFHGYAHGAEMPNLATPALYATGFVLATTFLHVVGIAIGSISRQISPSGTFLRLLGAGVAGIGFAILFGL